MGSTDAYGIPYPESDDYLADGANAMAALAEGVEDAVQQMFALASGGDAGDPGYYFYTPGGYIGELGWNIDGARKRGYWPGGSNSRLVVPPDRGYFHVSATVAVERLADWRSITVVIGTRTTDTDINDATIVHRSTVTTEGLADDDRVYAHVSGVLWVPYTTTGIVVQVRPATAHGAESGSATAPLYALGSSRLSIHRLSAL